MSFRLMHEMWIEKIILVIWTLSIWEEAVNVLAVSSHLLYTVKDRSTFYSLCKKNKNNFDIRSIEEQSDQHMIRTSNLLCCVQIDENQLSFYLDDNDHC